MDENNQPQPGTGAPGPTQPNPIQPASAPAQTNLDNLNTPPAGPTQAYPQSPPPQSPPTPPVSNYGSPVPNTQPVVVPPVQSPPFISNQKIDLLIFLVLSIIETLMAMRIVFRLLKANPANGFVNMVYSLTGPLISPFQGIFNTGELDQVVEVAVIISMILYALFAFGLSKFFKALQSK